MVTVIIRNVWPLLEDSSRPRDGTAEPVPLCSSASVDPTPSSKGPRFSAKARRRLLCSMRSCLPLGSQSRGGKPGVPSRPGAVAGGWGWERDTPCVCYNRRTSKRLKEQGGDRDLETETVGDNAGRRTCLRGGSPRLAPPGMASSPEPRGGRGQMGLPPAGALQPSHPLFQMGSRGSER